MKQKLIKQSLLAGALLLCTTLYAQDRMGARRGQAPQQPTLEQVKVSVVGGSSNRDKESVYMAADGHKWSKWCIDDGHMPYTIILDAKQPTQISWYGLTTGNDTYSYPMRNPQKWNLYGSNDQKTWTLVAEMKRDRRMSDENEQEYRYRLKEPATYRYYKFEFITLVDGVSMQLSEINLYK